jgi:hypothetical protein
LRNTRLFSSALLDPKLLFGNETRDSPWYPMMRLFRQKALADWDGVFRRLAATLRKMRKGHPQAAKEATASCP